MSLHQNLYTQAGAKANISAGGATPLHIAADNGSLELLNCLLKVGADPDVSDEVRKILKFEHYLLVLLVWESMALSSSLKVYLSQKKEFLKFTCLRTQQSLGHKSSMINGSLLGTFSSYDCGKQCASINIQNKV